MWVVFVDVFGYCKGIVEVCWCVLFVIVEVLDVNVLVVIVVFCEMVWFFVMVFEVVVDVVVFVVDEFGWID